MSLKILFVSPYDLTRPGGVTTYVRQLAHYLRAYGHKVTIVGPVASTVRPHSDTYPLGKTFRLPTTQDAAFVNLNPFVIKSVQRFLQNRHFDIIHLQEPFLPFIGPAFLYLGHCVKIGTFHATSDKTHIPYTVFKPLVAIWDKQLDGRIAVSATAKKTVNRYIPRDYTIIPNGIDFNRFAKLASNKNRAKNPTILFVGRLEKRKGLPYLLKAFQLVKNKIPNSRLLIIGDGGLRQPYQKLAFQLGLKDVIFKGQVPDKLLPFYYQQAHVVCVPSIANESFGLVILEAMASAKPVVASKIGGFPRLIQHRETGLLVPPKNVRALSNALIKVLANVSLANHLAKAAQEKAKLYSWDKVASKILNYYQVVISQKSV